MSALLLLAGLGLGQNLDGSVVGCEPRPIAGTVSYKAGAQAIETNAQAYGAAAFAERTLLQGSPWGFEVHTISGAVRVPTLAECSNGTVAHGSAALDLFSSSSGLMAPIPLGDVSTLRLFYSGSVSGSKLQFPNDRFLDNRVFNTYGYAFSGLAYTYVAPLAVLNQDDTGLRTRAGDFIIGAGLDVPTAPEIGTLSVGYVYSSGLYSNITSRKIRMFATALLTQRFELLSLVKGGFDRIPLPGESGRATLFGRRQSLLPPPGSVTDAVASRVDLTSLHYKHDDIGGLVSVSAAFAIQPVPILHEAALGVALPNDDGNGDPILDAGGVRVDRLFALQAGRTELPPLPWYGADGGGAFFAELSIMDMIFVRRNAPETLMTFPFAQGSTEFVIQIQVDPGLLEDR